MGVGEPTKPHEKLLHCWGKSGLALGQGEPEEDICAFEVRNGVSFPPDFREYLAHVDRTLLGRDNSFGLGGGDDLLSFWSLNEMRSVAQECSEHPGYEHLSRDFVFADWCLWCWAYAIRLAPPDFGRIRIIYSSDNHPFVAASFTEFVEAYVRDPGNRVPFAVA